MDKEGTSPRRGRRASLRPLQAGLLWRLLNGDTRRRVAPFLDAESLKALRRNFDDYRARARPDRILVEADLRKEGGTRWHSGPVLTFVAGMVVSGATVILVRQAEPRVGWLSLAAILTPLLLTAAGPLALLLLRPYQARTLFRFRAELLPWVLTAVCAVGLMWVLSFIGFSDRTPPRLPSAILIFVVFGAAGAPLLEEIFFREIIPSIFGKSPHAFGHVVSALLFAAAHMPDSVGMGFLYFAAAAALGALRVETNSLGYPVLAHSTANVAVLLL